MCELLYNHCTGMRNRTAYISMVCGGNGRQAEKSSPKDSSGVAMFPTDAPAMENWLSSTGARSKTYYIFQPIIYFQGIFMFTF